jgi:excisionase family DNA binding protein
MEKRVLNFKEACEFLGFAPSYLYKLTSAGTVPYSKPNGKTIFFDREKLEAWMLQNESDPKQRAQQAATYLTTKQ